MYEMVSTPFNLPHTREDAGGAAFSEAYFFYFKLGKINGKDN